MVVFLLVGCKSWTPAAITIAKKTISPKLLTLENTADELGKSLIYRTSVDELKIFNQELEENLTDPYGTKYGYISYKSRLIDYKLGLGYYIVSTLLMTIPNLLGLPFMNIKYEIESEIRILDRNKKLLAKFSAVGKSKTIVAYYYGYSLKYATRKTYIEAIIDGLNMLRPQIEKEAININEKLQTAGKI